MDDGTQSYCPEAPGKGIGNEGSKQSRQSSSPTEVCEGVGSLGQGHMQLLGQVANHVNCEPSNRQLLTDFISCTITLETP